MRKNISIINKSLFKASDFPKSEESYSPFALGGI